MKSCLVLGAGFSKSISNLPVTKEMFGAFKKEIENQRKLNNSMRVRRGERLFNFLETLENDFLKIPYSRVEKDGNILQSNYLENFEALCSFIDLNLTFEVHALCESKGIKSDLSGKPLFVNYTTSKLKEIRGYIGDYIYLSLINFETNDSLLNKFRDLFLINYPSIITFNYDLILERYLFYQDYWFPKDGYGFQPSELPELNNNYLSKKSSIEILKMHGSLNWEPSSMFHSKFRLRWLDDDDNCFFPGYLKDEKKRGFRYQGAFSSDGWILPSWIKQFTYNEIIQVWNQAYNSLSNSDEVIFIGYSMPNADSAVYSLLSSINWDNKTVKLYDPNADTLKENYSFVLRKNDIQTYSSSLENILS